MKNNLLSNRLLCLVLAMVMVLSLALTGCGEGKNTTGGGDASTSTTGGSADPSTGLEGQVLYTFNAKGEGGMKLAGVTLTITGDGNTYTGVTGDDGSYSLWLYPGAYTATITDGLKTGYTAVEMTTTEAGGSFDVIAETAVITDIYPSLPTEQYEVGDVMYDFSFVNSDGETVRLSELLETKKLVIINFWATWCSPCKNEFPAIQAAYEAYGDDVEVVAFSTYAKDTRDACQEFAEENGYTFNMLPDIGMYSLFTGFHGGGSIPCTIFVDRYGVINAYMVGGDSSTAAWKAEMAYYISDEYVQETDSGYVDDGEEEEEQEKPDVEMPESSAIAAATGFDGAYTGSSDEYTWPWVITADGKGIEPSNYGKDSTEALISVTTTIKAGQVFAFDYEYSIEYDEYGALIYDLFAVYVDGQIMQKMYTVQDGKVTCYAYTPVADGEYTVTLYYSKDSGDGYGYMVEGEEYIHVSNIRLVSIDEMTAAGGSLDVWTPAADTPADENAKTEYVNYVDVVLADDGFYHVGTADGPILLTQLYGSTQWSSASLYSLGYSGYLKINGVDYYNMLSSDGRSYLWLEDYSAIGYTAVDATLADLLDLFASKVGEGKNHDLEWLEFCCYFQHYGVGDGITSITDVRQGIDKTSAFQAQLGANYVYVNQTLVPRGLYYKFVPDKDGVYKFYSVTEGSSVSSGVDFGTDAWLWADDDNTWIAESGESDDQFVIYKNMTAGETYYISVALSGTEELGGFYFYIDYMGEDDGSYDVMSPFTNQYTSDLETGEILLWRMYRGTAGTMKGYYAALGTDGYYHVITKYDANGDPVKDENGNYYLDYSEHGYVYVNFLETSDWFQNMAYIDDYASMQKLIEYGYVYYGEDGYVFVSVEDGGYYFDFASRADIDHDAIYTSYEQWLTQFDGTEGYTEAQLKAAYASYEAWATAMNTNYQAIMEAYLAEATSGDESDFDYGYVKADEQLVTILKLMTNMHDSDGDDVEDWWLMFCSFAKHP